MKTILTIARFSPEKNLKLCIEAMQYLPDYMYMILGEGEQKEELIKYAKELKVKDRIIFEPFVEHRYIWKYYKMADVFWLMSTTEACSNVVQEAMFARVPCIVSNIDGMKNLVEDGETGLIVKSFNAKELAKKTIYLMSNITVRFNIIKNARKFILKRQEKCFHVRDLFK